MTALIDVTGTVAHAQLLLPATRTRRPSRSSHDGTVGRPHDAPSRSSSRSDAPLAEAARAHGHASTSTAFRSSTHSARLVGVISQTDLVRARATEDLWTRWPGLRVRHLMTSPALTIADRDDRLAEAASLMERERIHRLVVVGPDGAVPIGDRSRPTDLVRAIVEEAPA